MQQKVQLIIKALYDCLPISIENAGRGFYGSVCKVTFQKEPFVVSIKIFDDPKYMLLQAKEQTFITSHKDIKMPKVLFVYQNQDVNALVMEWAEGENLEHMKVPKLTKKESLAWDIVNQSIELHKITNKTYGYLYNKQYSSWQLFYKNLSQEMLERIDCATKRGLIDLENFKLIQYAFKKFDEIFSEQVSAASLIHGDLNIGNIIVKDNKVSAIIDPMGVMWGDREIELFQFECSGSDNYDLLEKYFSINKPSKKFELKNAFYKAFAETNHYCRIGKKQDDYLSSFFKQLEEKIIKFKL